MFRRNYKINCVLEEEAKEAKEAGSWSCIHSTLLLGLWKGTMESLGSCRKVVQSEKDCFTSNGLSQPRLRFNQTWGSNADGESFVIVAKIQNKGIHEGCLPSQAQHKSGLNRFHIPAKLMCTCFSVSCHP